MRNTLTTMLVLSVLFLSGYTAGGQGVQPKDRVVQTWDASSIVWQKIDPDGTKWAVLEGDKDAAGKIFTYAFFIPAGYWEHHWHTQDARVAVIVGALKVAQGDKLDKEKATTYPVGSYLFVPANVQHTMGADIDTIIIGTAKGPWKTHHHESQEQHRDHR
jgi:quercetin dioxygenase-like cupin family protein